MTFTPNGEVLESRRLYVVSPFGPLLETGGHGAWERAAHGGFLAKFIFLVQAAPNHPVFQNGEPLGSDDIRMRLNVDQPDTLSGTFMSQARDPQGTSFSRRRELCKARSFAPNRSSSPMNHAAARCAALRRL
jgi:hypothetical protein